MTTSQRKVGWGAALAATLFMFLVAMDQVMMPIATSAISKEFNTAAGTIQAMVALISLVAAPLYITGGKLGNIHGKKKVFMAGLVLYGIGTLTATLAPRVVYSWAAGRSCAPWVWCWVFQPRSRYLLQVIRMKDSAGRLLPSMVLVWWLQPWWDPC